MKKQNNNNNKHKNITADFYRILKNETVYSSFRNSLYDKEIGDYIFSKKTNPINKYCSKFGFLSIFQRNCFFFDTKNYYKWVKASRSWTNYLIKNKLISPQSVPYIPNKTSKIQILKKLIQNQPFFFILLIIHLALLISYFFIF